MQELEKGTMDGVVQLKKQLVDYTALLFHEVSTTRTLLIREKQGKKKLILSAFVILFIFLGWVFYAKFFSM